MGYYNPPLPNREEHHPRPFSNNSILNLGVGNDMSNFVYLGFGNRMSNGVSLVEAMLVNLVEAMLISLVEEVLVSF